MSAFEMRQVPMAVVRDLCERFHGYGSAGNVAVYAWGVFEEGRPVAAYAWQPPPPGAARAVCPEAPHAVLALSRMVAIPKTERCLKHISKPLREQMKRGIDRTRWPVLITYSDEGQGHTGYVYKCSGFVATTRRRVTTFHDGTGARVSRYADGKTDTRALVRGEATHIQRWEHWAVAPGEVLSWMERAGWRRVPRARAWRSGAPAFSWVKDA